MTVSSILVDLVAQSRAEPAVPLPELLARTARAELGVDGVGLWLMTAERDQVLLAATDGVARQLEDLQFTTGEGPCIDAFAARRPVLQPDLARTGPARWPAFSPAALDAGARAVFAFPLQLGEARIGVFDLYRREAGPLDGAATTLALTYADAATVLVLHQLDGSSVRLDPVVDGSWTGRSEVHQASGMVSVQAGVSVSEALLLLRARAYAEGRSVAAVAGDVLARTVRFGPVGGDPDG